MAFSIERMQIAQRLLWEQQHTQRRQEFQQLAHQPNPFAFKIVQFLPSSAIILELGCANGRDARYFAQTKNCQVIALDFSAQAIRQLIDQSRLQLGRIKPLVASIPHLPFTSNRPFIDAIYARSALQLDDTSLFQLFDHLINILKPNGHIFIQGKTPDDPKIRRSWQIADNLFSDPYENGHLRRAWTRSFMEQLASRYNLNILEIAQTTEVWNNGNNPIHFIHLIAAKK